MSRRRGVPPGQVSPASVYSHRLPRPLIPAQQGSFRPVSRFVAPPHHQRIRSPQRHTAPLFPAFGVSHPVHSPVPSPFSPASLHPTVTCKLSHSRGQKLSVPSGDFLVLLENVLCHALPPVIIIRRHQVYQLRFPIPTHVRVAHAIVTVQPLARVKPRFSEVSLILSGVPETKVGVEVSCDCDKEVVCKIPIDSLLSRGGETNGVFRIRCTMVVFSSSSSMHNLVAEFLVLVLGNEKGKYDGEEFDSVLVRGVLVMTQPEPGRGRHGSFSDFIWNRFKQGVLILVILLAVVLFLVLVVFSESL